MVKTSTRSAALKAGYRSGLELTIGKQINMKGYQAKYESFKIPYTKPASLHKYTPDFQLHNNIIIETKGRFITADRKKHLLIQSEHPELDIRFVFTNPNQKISKKSKTTYGQWCTTNNFIYAKGLIPEGWFKEKKRG